jgi:ABC-type nickel/cobalt efflux system permease component RcnA
MEILSLVSNRGVSEFVRWGACLSMYATSAAHARASRTGSTDTCAIIYIYISDLLLLLLSYYMCHYYMYTHTHTHTHTHTPHTHTHTHTHARTHTHTLRIKAPRYGRASRNQNEGEIEGRCAGPVARPGYHHCSRHHRGLRANGNQGGDPTRLSITFSKVSTLVYLLYKVTM